jgi:hypothetical protein
MDELDLRLRARLERLSDAVPVAATSPAVGVRPMRAPRARAGLFAAAAVVVVALAVVAAMLGFVQQRVASPSPSVVAPSSAPAALPAPDRFPDGIPNTFNGQPVYRGADAAAIAAKRTDATPFYIAGWLSLYIGPKCAFPDANPWLDPCGTWTFSSNTGMADADALVSFAKVQGGLASLSTGPVIAQVHVHDPRAAECGTFQADCEKLLVVSQVVWSGDAATEPAPLSADSAKADLGSDGASLVPLTADNRPKGCFTGLPRPQILVPLAAPTKLPAVAAMYVFQSPSERRTQTGTSAEGADAAWTDSAVLCDASNDPVQPSQDRWVTGGTIAVVVRVPVPATAAAHNFVARIAASLETASATPAPSPAWVALPMGDIQAACGAPLSGAVLQGSATNPRIAWLQMADGTTHNVVFPPGYFARFDPGLEIVNEAGRVVLQAGQSVDRACTWQGDTLLLLHP